MSHSASAAASSAHRLNRVRRASITWKLSLAALAAPWAAAAPTPAPPLRVALTGDAAPAGGNYNTFSVSPVLNGTGHVAFTASLTGGASTMGVFAGAPGFMQSAALQGAAAPSGGNYANLGDPVLNGAGQVAFTANLTGGSSTAGVFAGAPGSMQAVALQGTAAPAGGNYSSFSGSHVLNGAGQVAFFANLTGGSSTTGVFEGAPGSIQAVALKGAAAPAGGNYLGFGVPVLNGTEQVAFGASTTGGSSTAGVFVGAPGFMQAAALQAAAAPAGGNYSTFTNPVLNGAGQVAFLANLSGGSSTQGVFIGAPGSVQAAALVGTAAPAGGNYGTFTNPVLNGAGQVAFLANLTGGSSTAGVFAGAPGSMQAAAVQGTAAPAGGNYNAFSSPGLNGAGQVAFFATLTGAGITTANDGALFAGRPGDLAQIVREGDSVDVDPGPGVANRTVAASGINFLISGGQDGRGVSFNDDGTLIYRLTFTDGSSGVFTSSVPEPTGLLTLAAAALAASLRRRRPAH